MIVEKIKGYNGHGFIAICKCDWCGKEYKSKYSYIIRNNHHYCSKKCFIEWQNIGLLGENNPNYGNHLSKETKQKMSEAKQGKYDGRNNPNYGKYGKYASNWKNGKVKNSKGYVLVLKPNHPLVNNNGRVYEHRLVMEKYLERYLKFEEVVHHINNIKDDNRIENLMLFKNKSEHQKFHKQQVMV